MRGLKRYLEEYWNKNEFERVDAESRYQIKEAGVHYVIDHLTLDVDDKIELKKALSKRICSEQALVAQLIPATYLYLLIQDLINYGGELKNNQVIEFYETVAGLVKSSNMEEKYARPFGLLRDGPYMAIRQEGITTLVKASLRSTGNTIEKILNTEDKMNRFNDASKIIINFLDNHPTSLGSNRN